MAIRDRDDIPVLLKLLFGEEAEAFIHLAEIYSIGRNRLVRLLRVDGANQDQLKAYVEEQTDRAIRTVQEEWGLEI